MNRKIKQKTRAYMKREASNHVDLTTGECCETSLAEDAADALDLYGPAPDFEIPEWVFELAFEVANA